MIPVRNVVVESEEEHEVEEEAEAAEEVPKIVVVEEVEAGKTLFVRHLRVGSTDVGYFYRVGEEVEGRDGTEDCESEESPTTSAWHLFRSQLHDEIEGEVEEEVGDEDDEEGCGHFVRQEDYYRYQKIDDQKSDDKLKPENGMIGWKVVPSKVPVDRLERFLVVLHHLLGEFGQPKVDNSPSTVLWNLANVRADKSKQNHLNPSPALVVLLFVDPIEEDSHGCTEPEVNPRQKALQDQLKGTRNVHRYDLH